MRMVIRRRKITKRLDSILYLCNVDSPITRTACGVVGKGLTELITLSWHFVPRTNFLSSSSHLSDRIRWVTHESAANARMTISRVIVSIGSDGIGCMRVVYSERSSGWAFVELAKLRIERGSRELSTSHSACLQNYIVIDCMTAQDLFVLAYIHWAGCGGEYQVLYVTLDLGKKQHPHVFAMRIDCLRAGAMEDIPIFSTVVDYIDVSHRCCSEVCGHCNWATLGASTLYQQYTTTLDPVSYVNCATPLAPTTCACIPRVYSYVLKTGVMRVI